MCPAKCLSGFSSVLDWRPIEFMGLPSLRSCSLCNVVPKETFLLECHHALCSHCYKAVLQGSGRCPLDEESIQESEVQTLLIRPSHLQKWKMRCCNSSNGCDFVGNVEEATNHFLSDCAFHVVSCNRCSAAVLRRDIVSHYSERQCMAGSSSADGSQVSTDGSVLDIGRKIHNSLETITDRICAIETQLNNHAACIDGGKQGASTKEHPLDLLLESLERIHGELRNVAANMMSREEARETVDASLKSIKEEIQRPTTNTQGNQGITNIATDQVVEKLSSISRHLETLEHVGRVRINEALFCIRGILGLTKISMGVRILRYSDVSVICGYSVQLGICIPRCGFPYMQFFLQICPSVHDHLLEWPFCIPYRFVVLHALNGSNIDSGFMSSDVWANRPKSEPVRLSQCFPLNLSHREMIDRGYVHENCVLVRVSLKPQS
ncbi:uncharacterized protein LOC135393445 [Ornithodoros turicata]|uniref:uncharacterized protein LOC135393445 n=1 Tax=Ornithodoros turicata TaxID=34597 RepID=UPI0031397D51